MLETNFRTSLDRINKDEFGIRKSLTSNKLSLGISFLDEAFKGILPTDLLLIGAGTGIGKTELASNIAYKNGKRGKKVFGIFLEAYEGEIELRQKYRELAKFAKRENKNPDFLSWITGEEKYLDSYSPDLGYFENVQTKYRGKEYNIDSIERDLLAINETADLIVIDHLHYFDVPGQNENLEMTRIVRKISDIVTVIQRPVILVAHLRKDSPGSIIPSINDFHGTSNITKIATKVVTMNSLGPIDENRSRTLMKIPKFRMNGSIAHYVAELIYSHEYNDYLPEYRLGQVVNKRDGQEWAETLIKPKWFSGGKHGRKDNEEENLQGDAG